jgi:2-methylcitrate dehydratase PrpD
LAAKGLGVDDIAAISCDTAEGYVRRLWEPLEAKRRPPNPYAAKFSIPWCLGYALVHGAVGLEAFTAEHVGDPRILALAAKISYRVNPQDPYPTEYTGHVRVTMRGGSVSQERQSHLRGGHREPLSREEIEQKFRANCAYGGWPPERAERWLAFVRGAFDGGEIKLEEFRA